MIMRIRGRFGLKPLPRHSGSPLHAPCLLFRALRTSVSPAHPHRVRDQCVRRARCKAGVCREGTSTSGLHRPPDPCLDEVNVQATSGAPSAKGRGLIAEQPPRSLHRCGRFWPTFVKKCGWMSSISVVFCVLCPASRAQ